MIQRLLDWLEDRVGYRAIMSTLLDEKLPPGTAWAFTLGSILLFTLAVQFVTGVALGLYYAPTPDHAWDSVRYISTEVRAGGFLRGLHHWGASVIVVAAVLHMARVVLFGSYKKPREANWIVGLVILQVILAFGLTGYLLPWDQRAYWATTVTISIAKLTPLAGDALATLMRGGSEIGALTLTRWYAVHVLVLPALLVMLTLTHLYLMRRHHISGPVRRPVRAAEEKFFPHQAARDLTMALLVGTLLAVLAWKAMPTLEAPADPTSSDYVPRPEWYFLGLFQLLKYFPGKLEVIGALVVPGAVMTLLALLPWIDRGPNRHWSDRKVVLAAFLGGLAAAVTLTTLGARDKPAVRAAGDWSLAERGGALMIANDQRCARCHNPTSSIAGPIVAGAIRQSDNWIAGHILDPEVIAPGVRQAPATSQQANTAIMAAIARLRSSPPPQIAQEDAQAIMLVTRECLTCHQVEGAGGKQGPALKNLSAKYDFARLQERISDPTNFKPDTEMPTFGDTLMPEEIAAIAKWLIKR